MKTQRRHELKENDLVHMLKQARDYISEHSNQLLLGVVAVVAVVALVSWGVRSSTGAVRDAYMQKDELVFSDVETGRESLASLKTLTENAPSEGFALAALMQQGGVAQALASQADPAPDPEFNAWAKDAYEELLTRFADNPLATGIAHTGLATVAENEFVLDGNPAHKDTARRHLEAVKANAALNGTPLMASALNRLNLLDETFVVVEFAPALPEESAVDESPAARTTEARQPIAGTPRQPLTTSSAAPDAEYGTSTDDSSESSSDEESSPGTGTDGASEGGSDVP